MVWIVVRGAAPHSCLVRQEADPSGKCRFHALADGEEWRERAPSADWFRLVLVGEEQSAGEREAGSVTLELPPWTAFLEDDQVSTQLLAAWKISRAIRSAGVTRAIEFQDGGTFVQLAQTGYGSQSEQASRNFAKQEKERAQPSAPRVNRTGWGGGGRVKTGERFTVFRQWLAETFGIANLKAGSGVLDVAGGKGELAFKLVNYAEIPTTIVDPRPMDVPNMLKHLTRKHVQRLILRQAQTRCKSSSGHLVVKLPMPEHIRCFFWYPLDHFPGKKGTAQDHSSYVSEKLSHSPKEKLRLKAALESCSAICGMHADQATEAIVDWGLKLEKPFATIPCCVFPNLFPRNGSVRTHRQFCDYLVQKSPGRIRQRQLDFAGRNDVVYGGVPQGAFGNTTAACDIIVPSWSPLAAHLLENNEDHGDLYPDCGNLAAELLNNVENVKEEGKEKEKGKGKADPTHTNARGFQSKLVPEPLLSSLPLPLTLEQPPKAPTIVNFLVPGEYWAQSWALGLAFVVLFDFGSSGQLLLASIVWWILHTRIEQPGEPLERLLYAAFCTEKSLVELTRHIKACELSKRGYKLGTRYLPPIARIERNQYLQTLSDDGVDTAQRSLECHELRRAILSSLRALYTAYGGRKFVVMPKQMAPLISQLEECLKLVTSARALFFKQDGWNGACFSKTMLVLHAEMNKLCEYQVSSMGGTDEWAAVRAQSRLGPDSSSSEEEEAKALEEILANTRAVAALVCSARDRMRAAQIAELPAILDTLRQGVVARHAEIDAELGSLSKRLHNRSHASADKYEGQILGPPLQSAPSHLAEEEDKRRAERERAPQTHTQVYQGLVNQAGRLEESISPGLSLMEEDDEVYDSRSLNVMFSELSQVLKFKRAQQAPEKVVRGAQLDLMPLTETCAIGPNKDERSSGMFQPESNLLSQLTKHLNSGNTQKQQSEEAVFS